MPEKYEDIFTVVIIGTLITLLVAAFLVSFVYMYQKRHFSFLLEKKLLHNKFQEELLQTRLEIQEETFRNISQEIHDNIGQSLSFVKLNLNTIDIYDTAMAIDKLAESKNQLTKTIQDLRGLARSLNPDFINEIGLPAAILQLLQFLDKTQQYHTHFDVEGEEYKNGPQRELVAYRIVQELLNNIVKHAGANEITIAMQYMPGKFMITVADNGKGFITGAPPNGEDNNGLGLRNMHSRMAMIQGTIAIDSMPGNGTRAVIELPRIPGIDAVADARV